MNTNQGILPSRHAPALELSERLEKDIEMMSNEELTAAYNKLPETIARAEHEVEDLKGLSAFCVFHMNELQSRAQLGLISERELDIETEKGKFERSDAEERLAVVANSIETLKLTLKTVTKNINLRKTNERERKNDWLQSYATRNIADAEAAAVSACALVCALRGFKERRPINTELRIMPMSAIESMLVRHCGGRQGTEGIDVFTRDLEAKIVAECEMKVLNGEPT